jgi:hypothetical protein
LELQVSPPVHSARRVVALVRALIYDVDPEGPVGIAALRHGTHCAARSVREWAGDWAGGGATAAGMGDRDKSICAKELLGQRRRTHVFEGLPVKGQAGSIIPLNAELGCPIAHEPATVLAILGVWRLQAPRAEKAGAAAPLVHADVARNIGQLTTVFRVNWGVLRTQKSIR